MCRFAQDCLPRWDIIWSEGSGLEEVHNYLVGSFQPKLPDFRNDVSVGNQAELVTWNTVLYILQYLPDI